MKVYVLLDENNKVLNTTEIKLLENQIECDYDGNIEDLDPLNIDGFSVLDGKLVFDKEKVVKKSLETEIINTLNAMVLNIIPNGEVLTKENSPTLVDIIKPENQGDKPEEGKFGDINNPIEVVGNVSTDGFLYTYGLYYSYGGKKYKCERGGAPDTQGSIKLYYTPDQLIGHYFVAV